MVEGVEEAIDGASVGRSEISKVRLEAIVVVEIGLHPARVPRAPQPSVRRAGLAPLPSRSGPGSIGP